MLTFAGSTRCTYSSQFGPSLKFYSYLNTNPVPISAMDLGLCVAYTKTECFIYPSVFECGTAIAHGIWPPQSIS